MALMTASEYVDSLAARRIDLRLFGEKIASPTEHPIIRPSIHSVAMTYKLAGDEDAAPLAKTGGSLAGGEVNRFNALFSSADDLVRKVKLQRLLGQRTASCFQRCVGMDAMNAVFSTTFDVDAALGTDYHARFRAWMKDVQERDLFVQGGMTDVKGDRGLAPSEQTDPDLFLRVVERRKDGIVIRGAKACQTGTVCSHEMLLMPTLRLREGEESYAVCCAVPTDAEGVVVVYGRQSCDTRKLEDGDIDVGNAGFGGHETLNIFNDVFVPAERVFLCGERAFVPSLVERFAAYHRQSYGGCKAGVGDVLIGAAACIADYNGVARASHVREKIAEMIHLNETIHACGLACSHEGFATPAGNYQSHVLLANICKHNVTRFPYELCRLAEDVAGGLLVTMPSEKDLRDPETGPYLTKYLRGRDGVPAEARMRILTLIHSITMGTSAPSYRTESMHGAGSPQAQKIMIHRQTDVGALKRLALRLSGVESREDPLA